ncbi:hypothetical protein LCGC14_3087350, partial [marine sediment metagenome]
PHLHLVDISILTPHSGQNFRGISSKLVNLPGLTTVYFLNFCSLQFSQHSLIISLLSWAFRLIPLHPHGHVLLSIIIPHCHVLIATQCCTPCIGHARQRLCQIPACAGVPFGDLLLAFNIHTRTQCLRSNE